MKVLHIIPSIEESTGGPARSSQGLVAALEKYGVEAYLVVFNKNDKPWMDEVINFKAFERSKWWDFRNKFENFIEEIKPDIIHTHCLWGGGVHLACVTARKKKIPYVMAPRGMLEPWALSQKEWKKKIAMCLYQRSDLRNAVALHATAYSEAEQFRRLGFSQPIIVSPNGITLPKHLSSRTSRKDGKKVILFLSRIHPKKGLMTLVEAVSRIKQMSLFDRWHVEYAGPDYESHLSEVQDRITSLGLQNEFSYLGNLDEERKWDAYSRADIFVLPTHSENFGIVIAEALYAQIPVITTKGAPWEELETEQCGKWIDMGVPALTHALNEMMDLSDFKREMMGERGRKLVETKYAWPFIAKKMKIEYETILDELKK